MGQLAVSPLAQWCLKEELPSPPPVCGAAALCAQPWPFISELFPSPDKFCGSSCPPTLLRVSPATTGAARPPWGAHPGRDVPWDHLKPLRWDGRAAPGAPSPCPMTLRTVMLMPQHPPLGKSSPHPAPTWDICLWVAERSPSPWVLVGSWGDPAGTQQEGGSGPGRHTPPHGALIIKQAWRAQMAALI